jgi:hypothetical protein
MCADCHAFPPPASFPKAAWKAEVAQGYRFYDAAPIKGFEPPPQDATLAYFESRAPETLDYGAPERPEQEPLFGDGGPLGSSDRAPAIASMCYLPDSGRLWACDMRNADIWTAERGGELIRVARPVVVSNPARLEIVDIDGDGVEEVLAADLASFLPKDHNQGGVWSLFPQRDWRGEALLSPAARVSDVRAGDLDGDGDVDLAVAEFGWRQTGRLLLLWNNGPADAPRFREQELDKRHGAIHCPLVDLNADGRLDIVALFAQEHEAVCAYIQQEAGQFQRVDLYEAGDPAFGSSGIDVTDFDGDGDLDVLHTNGDSFDHGHAKPYHGIRWLENRSDYPFTVHELAPMPGVHRALAGDLDLDGDTDVAAVSLMPAGPGAAGRASILWLEQSSGGFVRHVIEVDRGDHACCELVDWDDDGDLDLIVGNFSWNDEPGEPLTLHVNRTH